MKYSQLTYSYTTKINKQGNQVKQNRALLRNLETGKELTIDVNYKVWPIQAMGPKNS